MKSPIFIGSLFIFSAVKSWACACIPMDIKKEYDSTDYVMIATVVELSARDFDPYDDRDHSTDYEVALKIKKNYKGDLRKSPHIMTAVDESRCGMKLKTGETYVLWLSKPDLDNGGSVPVVSLCSRSKRIGEAKEDLMWLDKKSNQALFSSVLFN